MVPFYTLLVTIVLSLPSPIPPENDVFRKKSSSPRGLLVTHYQSASEATNGRTIFTKK